MIGSGVPRFRGSVVLMAASLAMLGVSEESAERDVRQRPNFAADVAQILYANCVVCHRPDTAAPFSLLSYDDVRLRGKELVEAVTSRRMPPWGANTTGGFPELQHDRRLTNQQIDTLTRWVATGMPAGDLARAPLPPVIPAAWLLGVPDLTVSLPRRLSIPPDSSDRLFNVVLQMDLPADRWITAIDYQLTARSILSHAVFFSVPAKTVVDDEDLLPGFSGRDDLRAADRSLETLGVWVPAGRPWPTPDRTGIRLPRGSNIVIQFHARAADTGAIEDGAVAIYFSKTPPVSLTSLQVPPSFGVAAGIDLPAGEPRVVVKDEFTLPVDVTVFGGRGHGHDLARDMKMTARLPGGSTRALLWIDRWEVGHQQTYYFTAPVRLPKGTVVHVEMTYDNSPANPRNRSKPPRRVGWGSRLSDEIGSMSLIIAEPGAAYAALLADERAKHFRDQLLKSVR